MEYKRRITIGLLGLSLAAAGVAGPAASAQPVPGPAPSVPLTDPSDGFCNPDEDGVVKLGGDNHLYECRWYDGLGWYWTPF